MSKALHSIHQSLERGRLGHALLLHGDCIDTLEAAACEVASKLLGCEHSKAHPDFFMLRPANKMRQIGVDPTRSLIKNLQQTPMQGERKVAIILEADRFHTAAANAFLKTLEEPPADTTILMLTSRLHGVLLTLRSRCQLYAIPAQPPSNLGEAWTSWLKDYHTWLDLTRKRLTSVKDLSARVMGLYRLLYLFEEALRQATDAAWEKLSKTLAEGLSDEEKDALEVGTHKQLRRRLFQDIAKATRNNALAHNPTPVQLRTLTQSIDLLEHNVRLLDVNLNEAVVLETYLLTLIRKNAG